MTAPLDLAAEHLDLALSVLAEIAADAKAPSSACVHAAGLLLEHHGRAAGDPTPVRFAFTLADGEQPDVEE